jgi:glycosyltransferase involved in cell wall biosynthesis
VRVVYVGRGSTGHDRRFVQAWAAGGADVDAIEAQGMPRDELAARLADLAPDVVHTGPVTSPAADVAAVWDGPLIATSWSFDLLADVDHDPEDRRRAESVLKRADLVFVDNAGPRRVAVELGASPDSIVEFPWGVDAGWLASHHRARRPEGETIFLSTRRHEPIYRVGDVLQAFLAIAGDYPGIRLRLAGSGSLSPGLEASASASPHGDRVEFLGEVDNDVLPAVYADADVYVTTSSVDGSSVSLLEAMAGGVPVVASRIEGNAQWVTPETGLDYPLGDVAALAELLRGFATPGDPVASGADRRAAAALQLVRERADWDATVRRFPGFAAAAIERATARRATVGP